MTLSYLLNSTSIIIKDHLSIFIAFSYYIFSHLKIFPTFKVLYFDIAHKLQVIVFLSLIQSKTLTMGVNSFTFICFIFYKFLLL